MRLRLILGIALTTLSWTCWAQTNQTAFLAAFAHVPACAVSLDFVYEHYKGSLY